MKENILPPAFLYSLRNSSQQFIASCHFKRRPAVAFRHSPLLFMTKATDTIYLTSRIKDAQGCFALCFKYRTEIKFIWLFIHDDAPEQLSKNHTNTVHTVRRNRMLITPPSPKTKTVNTVCGLFADDNIIISLEAESNRKFGCKKVHLYFFYKTYIHTFIHSFRWGSSPYLHSCRLSGQNLHGGGGRAEIRTRGLPCSKPVHFHLS